MERQETLRDLFDGVARDPETRALFAADPDGFLADHGFGEVPADLLPDAVVHYADTAPLEVAEQLSPFVMANSPVALDEPLDPAADALGALAGVDLDVIPATDAIPDADAASGVTDPGDADLDDLDDLGGSGEADGFAFGAGHDAPAATDTSPAPDAEEVDVEGSTGPIDLYDADPVDLDALTPDALTPDVPSIDQTAADQAQVDESDLAEDDWSDVI